jgi:hypothetical protein
MILLLGAVVTSLGCPRGPKRVLPPPIDAYAAGLKAIEFADANKDGALSGKELDKCPGLKAACVRSSNGMGGFIPSTVDPANTGRITAEMITDRIKAWQASRLGRMSLRCMVTWNGQPLEGADVNFVPEPFLGPYMKTASGVTDQNGVAMLSIPPGPEGGPPGVPPGFYRVEITKPAKAATPGRPPKPAAPGQLADPGEPGQPARTGLNIPAKYNTQTILGQEVAIDAEGVRSGIKFDLIFMP